MKTFFCGFTFAWVNCLVTIAAISPEDLAELKQRAMTGEAEALYRLGEIYEYGNGVNANVNRAFSYYLPAARAKHKEALARVQALREILDAEKMVLLGESHFIELGKGVKMELLSVPAGTFLMGSPRTEAGRLNHEAQTRVTLSAFSLGKTEVTQAQWTALMGKNPSKRKGDDLPVEMVSWYDAIRFCEKLTEYAQAEGRLPKNMKFTLPTEAQWEYACRAGTLKAFYAGEQESDLSRLAWWRENADAKTHPVADRHANRWSFYDMLGNVREWCLDRYAERLSDGKDPLETEGTSCVCRGGAWNASWEACRAASRAEYSPSTRSADLGFRVALVKIEE